MPRDKTDTHMRVLEAARTKFLECGYENASIREIASLAGITSAGLYRHCKDKEDLFAQVVSPAVEAIHDWLKDHIKKSYAYMEQQDVEGLNSQNEVDMVRQVMLPYRKECILLMSKSAGTRYEHFIRDLVCEHEEKMWEGLQDIAAYGFQVKTIPKEDMHVLITAYVTALFEPLIQDYSDEEVLHYLDLVEAFFMPGWCSILGI
ncbi:MAG: TetR/AcrR family transcriptional regulator [Lachnospiraceae bacterium]|nr:TetR/AcrR family transcriptional regulator [Lachnospiraceae bacterium]